MECGRVQEASEALQNFDRGMKPDKGERGKSMRGCHRDTQRSIVRYKANDRTSNRLCKKSNCIGIL